MGDLATVDGKVARCTVHGGTFRVLFCRTPAATAGVGESAGASPAPAGQNEVLKAIARMSVEELSALVASPEKAGQDVLDYARFLLEQRSRSEPCRQHPTTLATAWCAECGAPLCATCAFQRSDGTTLCPFCAQRVSAATGLAAPTAGVVCVRHAAVAAVARCKVCGAGVCQTCDFVFPGDVHLCPECATKAGREMSPRRKRLVLWSYVLAVWATVWFGVLISGALAGLAKGEAGEQVVGMLVMFVLFVPALVGTALGVSAWERRASNPPWIWGAVIWNGLMLAGFLLLCVAGLFMGG